MFKCIFICCIVIFFSDPAFSQILSGKVVDKLSNEKVENAVVYLLRSRDSILVDFARTKPDGTFKLIYPKTNEVFLIISHPKYVEYLDFYKTDTLQDNAFQKIYLTSTEKLLQEVIVKGRISRVRTIGDTIEFNAEMFKLAPKAPVSDLLKLLPGLKMDKNGTITAYGERVQQVLVDGEEYFSLDPSLITQNLNADMVSKVQLYNKKTNIAKATGVDDGNSVKTLNLKLKQDMKKSFFGRMMGGAGTSKYFDNLVFFNRFNLNEKFAIYGNYSNIGRVGLNSKELEIFNDKNNVSNIGDLDKWNGGYEKMGLPIEKAAGAFYSNKWHEGDNNLRMEYRYRDLFLQGQNTSSSNIYQFLNKNIKKENTNFKNNISSNLISGIYESKPDSFWNIKAEIIGQSTIKKSEYDFIGSVVNHNSNMLNDENRQLSTISKFKKINSSLQFTKYTRKPRRNFQLTLSQKYHNESSYGFIIATQQYYNNNVSIDTQNIDQYKTNNFDNFTFIGKLTYLEPVSPKSFLILGLSFENSNSISNYKSFNKALNNEYANIDSANSSYYTFSIRSVKPSLGYTLIGAKSFIISTFGISKNFYLQKDKFQQLSKDNSFTNFYSSIRVDYRFTNKKRISMQYDGVIVNPTLQQLQETSVNTDPLNIFIGNPKLKPSGTHKFGILYIDNKPSKERSLVVRLNHTFVKNEINYQLSIDSFGRNRYLFINLNGNFSCSENIVYDFRIDRYNINISMEGLLSQEKVSSVVNNNRFTNKLYSTEFAADISKLVEDKYEFNLSFGVINKSGIFNAKRKDINNYAKLTITPEVKLNLPFKLNFFTSLEYTFLNSSLLLNRSLNFCLWNVSINKTFFKNNDLSMTININDILNKNKGISVDVFSNSFSQNNFNVIKNYGIVNVAWNFNQKKAAK